MITNITNKGRMFALTGSIVLILGLGLAFATPAKAQTIADLQTQIQALLAQIAALQGGSTSGTACFTFTRNHQMGDAGGEVVQMQRFLNANGAVVASVGAGSPGNETAYFGALTRAAVARYQAMNGITPSAGYWGPITRANANSKCVPGPVTPGPVTPPSADGPLRGGAGDIVVSERSSGTENEVLEGENDVRVLGFEVEAEGSDVRLSSVRVELVHTGSGSKRLERYADEVCVFMGNRSVGCSDVDDLGRNSNVYSRNIPVNAIVRNNQTERFYVAVSAARNVDSNDIGENWVVGVGSIRFQDALGAILTDTTGDGVSGGDNGPISETFTFEDLSSAGDVRLQINEGDDDVNNARTVQVSETSDTNGVEVLSFELEARGSDIHLDKMTFAIVSNGAGVTEIANDFRLMMGRNEVGRVTLDRDNDGGSDGFASTTDTTVWIVVSDLEDDDVIIDEGDEESFTLVADINDIDGNFTSGDFFESVSLSGANVAADNRNGDSVTVNGSATSNDIRFSSSGITARVTSTPSPTSLVNAPDSNSDNQGQYVIEFEVTAIEDTAWIKLDAASSTDANGDNVGVAFSMETTGDAPAQIGETTGTLERISGGTVSGNFVRINSNQTAKFRLTVYYDPTATGIYRVQMNSIGFNQSSAADPNQEHILIPSGNFQSGSVQILN